VPGNYELVITSFHGGPFIRYRLGHLVQITARRNQQLNIDIPQMRFLTRIDDQIDIAGFTRLSEKVIWQAIESSGIPYEEWTVHKEVEMETPVLHLYIELKENSGFNTEDISSVVHEELKKLDKPYAELQEITGLKPLRVTILPQSTFYLFKLRQQRSGADLSHLRPPHLNPPEQMLESLLSAAPGIEVTVTERAKVPA
jgi:phenylacetate-coenzyme A ligase PaaK-like adenylate-forming protein